MPEFTGNTVIVTGASTGIGEAAAEHFAAEGASVVVADVNVADAEATVTEIRETGGEATFVETDVSDPSSVEQMVETAVETYGGLDCAVNNAGIEGANRPLADQSLDEWERVVGVNLTGVFLGMRAEIPAMLDSGGGAIVNTASIASEVGFRESGPYVASKHGVVGLTKTAALEYSGEGVRVNAVCPGIIETPMLDRAAAENPETIEQVSAATPAGRTGQPEEVGDAIAWLCSEAASFVTGEAMVVDGGYVAQ